MPRKPKDGTAGPRALGDMLRLTPEAVADHDLACGDTVRTDRGLGVISSLTYQPAWPDFIQVDLACHDDANRWSGERRQFHWEDVKRVAPGPRDRSFWTGP